MCVTCVAEGAMYVGGAGVGLRLMAARAAATTRRRLRETGVDHPDGVEPSTLDATDPSRPTVEISTGTPHL